MSRDPLLDYEAAARLCGWSARNFKRAIAGANLIVTMRGKKKFFFRHQVLAFQKELRRRERAAAAPIRISIPTAAGMIGGAR